MKERRNAFMYWFGTSPQKRAKKAWAAADRTKRVLEQVSVEARRLDYKMETLAKLSKDLPPHAPVAAIRNAEVSMNMTERHANRMLKHLREMNEHMAKLDEHLKTAESKK
jgi:hypothetical protein